MAAAVKAWDPEKAELAPYERRLVGFVIDAVILIVISLPAAIVIIGGQAADEGFPIELSLTLEVISGIYFVGLIALRGQTFGKMIARTRVVDLDRGDVPSWTAAFIRWAVPAAVAALPVFGLLFLVVYAWLIWDHRNQGLHDKAARTLVVGVRPRPSGGRPAGGGPSS